MVKNEELFVLIKSLSKSEKRYFRMFCSQTEGDSNYLKLFDVIDKQKIYNEKDIKRQFRDEAFSKQLHVTKNYLRRLIMKSLRNFHGKLSKDAEIKDLIKDIEILFHKELYDHCLTELEYAERIAKSYELTTSYIELFTWKRKVIQARRPQNYHELDDVLQNQKDYINILLNTNQYWQIAVQSTRIGPVINSGNYEKLELLTSSTPAITLEAKVLYYNTKYLHHLQRSENQLAENALIDLINLLEINTARITEEPGLYISTINNLLSFYVFTKNNEKALQLIAKAKAVYEKFELASANKALFRQISRTFNVELEIYRAYEPGDINLDYIKKTEAFVKENQNKMPREYLLSFSFQLAYIKFIQKDFSSSLHWINVILNLKHKNLRTDLQVQARILNLMVHLELKNYVVLLYFADSTKRYIKKANQTQNYFDILLRFFVKMGKEIDFGHKKLFTSLHEELFPEEGESIVPTEALDFIDFERWIGSKIGIVI